jgi:hypothetical protein
MQNEPHARARLLMDQAAMEGISPDEQRWLHSHMEGCAECGRYGELSRRAIRALDSFAFDLDREAAARVQAATQSRADLLAASEWHGRRLWIGTAVALLLTGAGSMAMWQPAVWLAGRWNLPTPEWQIGFVTFWLLPSALLGALPVLRSKLMGADSGAEGETI